MPKHLLQKGERNIGRKRGVPNVNTKTQRQLLLNILAGEEDKIKQTLAGLKGETYLKHIDKLIKYITPVSNIDPVVERIEDNSPAAVIERATIEWQQKIEEEKAKEIIIKPIRKWRSVAEQIEEKRLLDLEKQKQNGETA